jgi:hypothetical protein
MAQAMGLNFRPKKSHAQTIPLLFLNLLILLRGTQLGCLRIVEISLCVKYLLFSWEEKLIAPLIATPNGEVRK